MNWVYNMFGCDAEAGPRACAKAISTEVAFLDSSFTVILAIAAFIAFFVGLWKKLTDRSEAQALVDLLQDPDSWGKVTERLSAMTGGLAQPGTAQAKSQAFKDGLQWLSDQTDRLFGDRLISFGAFSTCLTIAFIYPIVAALLTWLFTGHGNIGGIEIGAEGQSFAQRLGAFSILVIGGGVAFWIARNADRLSVFVGQALTNRLFSVDQRVGFLPKATRWSVELLAYAVAVAFAVAVAGAVAYAGAVAVAYAGAVAVAGAVAYAVAYAVAGALAVAVAVAVCFAVAFAFGVAFSDPEYSAIILFFYVALPLLNAFADMLSLAATRCFVRRIITRDQSWGAIALEMAADILIALTCLFGLICLITFGLDQWQIWGGTVYPPPLNWGDYRDQVLNDPATGLMLGLMCFTTLVPTLIHFASGARGMWLYRSAELDRARTALYALDHAAWHTMPLADRDAAVLPITRGIKRAFRKSGLLTAGCCLGLTLLFTVGVWGGALGLAALGVAPFA